MGKSWGKLSKVQQKKYERLSCNLYSRDKNNKNTNNTSTDNINNPSCNDQWGDNFLHSWRASTALTPCEITDHSGTRCHVSKNLETYCTLLNAQIDFSKMHLEGRDNLPNCRSFARGFISLDCPSQKQKPIPDLDYTPWPKYISLNRTEKCDVYIEGTTLMYTHDHIVNLCHMVSVYSKLYI